MEPENDVLIVGECIGDFMHAVEEIPSKEDCLNICKDTKHCKWFTYTKSLSTCLLMASCQTLDETCQDCTSGEYRCLEEPDGKMSV